MYFYGSASSHLFESDITFYFFLFSVYLYFIYYIFQLFLLSKIYLIVYIYILLNFKTDDKFYVIQLALSYNDFDQSKRELAIVLIVFNILFYLQLGDTSQKLEYAF